MSEPTREDVTPVPRFPPREQAITYVETHLRTPELARFLTWIRQGPETSFTWDGKRWERWLTPKQGLLMALCREGDLKVLQQNPTTGSTWAQLARDGHEVWQVLLDRRYVGVLVDGTYRSYEEIRRSRQETTLHQPRS